MAKKKYKGIDLFCGIGGFRLAMEDNNAVPLSTPIVTTQRLLVPISQQWAYFLYVTNWDNQ